MGLLVAETICFAGFFIELGRANGGNALSWAYVVEWPIFALYAIYMWWRLRREEVGETPHSNPPREDHSDEALERYTRAEARAKLLDEYISAKMEAEGVEAVRPYLWTEAARADSNAAKFAQDLGLDPAGRSRIARDIGLARKLFDPGGAALAELGATGRKLRQLRGRDDG